MATTNEQQIRQQAQQDYYSYTQSQEQVVEPTAMSELSSGYLLTTETPEQTIKQEAQADLKDYYQEIRTGAQRDYQLAPEARFFTPEKITLPEELKPEYPEKLPEARELFPKVTREEEEAYWPDVPLPIPGLGAVPGIVSEKFRIPGQIFRAGIRGVAEEATLGLAKLPEWQPKTGKEALAYIGGKFTGFALPLLYGGGMGRFAIKPLLKAAGKGVADKAISRIIASAVPLGMAISVSDIKDPSKMPERFMQGATFGAIFGVTGMMSLPKTAPFLNMMIRQFGSRTLGNMAKIYEPSAIKDVIRGIATDEFNPELANRFFDELLFTVFSLKGASPADISKKITTLAGEIKTTGLRITPWEKIGANQIRTSTGKLIRLEDFFRKEREIGLPEMEPTTMPEKPIAPEMEIRVSKDPITGEAVIKIPKTMPEVVPTIEKKLEVPGERAIRLRKKLAEKEEVEIPRVEEKPTWLTKDIDNKLPAWFKEWRLDSEKYGEMYDRIVESFKPKGGDIKGELKAYVMGSREYISRETGRPKKPPKEEPLPEEIITEEGRIFREPAEEKAVLKPREPTAIEIEKEVRVRQRIEEIRPTLTEKQQRIIEEALIDPKSLKDVAKRAKTSHESVRQLYKKLGLDEELKAIADGKELERVVDSIAKEVREIQREKYPKVGLATKRIKPMPKEKQFRFDKEVEQRFEAAKGVPKTTTYQKVAHTFKTLQHAFTRTYINLPHGEEWAEAHTALKTLEKQKAVTWDRTTRVLNGITINRDPVKFDLFRRKVILNDLKQEAELGHELPFGFDKKNLANEIKRLDTEISKYPDVQDALNKRDLIWNGIKTDYIYYQAKIGNNIEGRLTKKDYFRHQVLQYASIKGIYTKGTGRKLRVPRGRGFLKERKGSILDINTDYLEAESEVMAQMLYDTELARALDQLKPYDTANAVKKEAKKQKMDDWHKAIPDGYSTWQPREGNIFYTSYTVPEKLAKEIMESGLAEPQKLNQALTMGRRWKEWVIKDELAKTLDNLKPPSAPEAIITLVRGPTRVWKIWVLTSPRRYFKYNIRNLTGDADHVFVGNPEAFKPKYTFRAAAELYKYLVGNEPVGKETQAWINRGGIHTTLPAQEIGKLRIFKDLYSGKKKITDLPQRTWTGYWRAVRLSTDMREAVLRLANVYSYNEQMRANPEGRPKNFGASMREEIMAIKDTNDRSFRLANELLGAYDEISVAGKFLREYIYPFWSWKELNFKIYYRLFKNAALDNRLAGTVGRKLAVTAPLTALRVGRFAIKASAFWAMMNVWNHTIFPDEEASLPPDIKNRPHLVLGTDDKGEVQYFSRIGALGDFLEWFGLDAAPGFVSDYLNGRKSMKEIAKEMARSPVNQVVMGISPFIKSPIEMMTRRALFPDVFNPRTIRNRGLHLARELALDAEYKAIVGLPSEPYKDTIGKAFLYKIDPLASAYHQVFDLKNDFLEKSGKRGEGFWLTPRTNALYYMKLAHRYGLKDDEQKYLKEYLAYHFKEQQLTGKTDEELEKSITQGIAGALRSMYPLSGMNQAERKAFVESLSEDEKEILAKAIRYYTEVLIGTTQFNEQHD